MPSSVSKNYKLPPTGLHTVHKTQGLTLPHITVSFDSQMLQTAVCKTCLKFNYNQ